MATFQLDECLSDKKLAKACAERALAEVVLFPRGLKGKQDPDLIETFVVPNGKTFLTKDRNLARMHCARIPERHPGFVIVANSYKHNLELRLKEVNRIIGRFKDRFPDWHTFAWNNSVVILTQETVSLEHIQAGKTEPVQDGIWLYEADGWDGEFKAVLQRNACWGGRVLDGREEG